MAAALASLLAGQGRASRRGSGHREKQVAPPGIFWRRRAVSQAGMKGDLCDRIEA